MCLNFKSVSVIILSAVFTCNIFAASKAFIMKKSGKKEYYDQITSDDRGVLKLRKGKITQKLNPGSYIYAYVSMPVGIKKATSAYKSKKYSDAAGLFEKCYSKYKFLGWDVYCCYVGAKALQAAGKNSDAISMLTKITKVPVNPNSRKYYMPAKKLLATLYFEASSFDKAKRILESMAESNDDSAVMFANNLLGDIFAKQGKPKDAKLEYMKTALLFDHRNKKERPEAFVKIIKMLRAEKNNKALEFEKKLRADYPGSKYLQDL